MIIVGLLKFALGILIVFCVWFLFARLIFRGLGIKDESFTIEHYNKEEKVYERR